MKIIRRVSREEVMAALLRGAGTSYERESPEQKEYLCVDCQKAFFSSHVISHSRCDDCFGPYNARVLTERFARFSP